MIKKINLFVFSLVFYLALNNLSCCVRANEKTYNNYEVIDLVTGNRKDSSFYAEKEIMQTYSVATSEMLKTLAKHEVDLSQVDVILYFGWMLNLDEPAKIQWRKTKDNQTVSSPWMQLSKSTSITGETRIQIRFDATYSRLIFDLFGESEHTTITTDFLGVPLLQDNCFETIVYDYLDKVAGSDNFTIKQIPKSFDCAPTILRQPLFTWFKSSQLDFSGTFLFSVLEKLEVNCQESAQEYYRKLYPLLAVRALEILESQSQPNSMWWSKVSQQVGVIRNCNYDSLFLKFEV